MSINDASSFKLHILQTIFKRKSAQANNSVNAYFLQFYQPIVSLHTQDSSVKSKVLFLANTIYSIQISVLCLSKKVHKKFTESTKKQSRHSLTSEFNFSLFGNGWIAV